MVRIADGTDHGTIKLIGAFTAGRITVSGPVVLTGGTGAYRHIKGTGKVTCSTAKAEKSFTCTVNGKGCASGGLADRRALGSDSG